jgi:hypothetical protein
MFPSALDHGIYECVLSMKHIRCIHKLHLFLMRTFDYTFGLSQEQWDSVLSYEKYVVLLCKNLPGFWCSFQFSALSHPDVKIRCSITLFS